MKYSIKLVHRVAPSEKDVCHCNTLEPGDFSDSRKLAAALRRKGLLQSGVRLRSVRVEGNKTVCFPDRGIWHSLTITEET